MKSIGLGATMGLLGVTGSNSKGFSTSRPVSRTEAVPSKRAQMTLPKREEKEKEKQILMAMAPEPAPAPALVI